MRILQLCSKTPNPPFDGGALAMDALTHGLLKLGVDVKVFAISTDKHPFEPGKIPASYKEKTKIETCYIDTNIKPFKAFLNLFNSGSYNVERFYSKTFEEKLIAILKANTFDIIHLETLFVTPYIETIRKHSKAKIVLRSHNVEFKIWERSASNTSNPIKKAYLNFLTKRLKKYEKSIINSYDAIASITPEDAETFRKLGCTKPVTIIPFGIDIEVYNRTTSIKEEFPSLFHIGAMNWRPNEDGVKWFLENVWDMVHVKYPDLKFYLAGRNMPEWLKNLNKKNVIVVGEVNDATEFIRSKGIMIAPLVSGSGMRIKIVEAMALGKTVISTSIGAEGIPYENEKNMLIANTPLEFIKHIDLCIKNTSQYQSICINAKKLVHEHFNNSQICSNLLDLYKKLLG